MRANFLHSARSFRRNPGILALAVVTLALGIGSTTAIFKVVDALLIRPLPYPDSERLFELSTERVGGRQRIPGMGRGVLALRSETAIFSAVEAYQFGFATLTGDGEPSPVAAARVSPGVLQMLGAVPRLGRPFYESDSVPGTRVVLISDRLWTSRFGRSPDAINRRLTIDDEPHIVVGVLPGAFAFPERTTDVWQPLVVDPVKGVAERANVVVMLRPGATPAGVNDRLAVISARFKKAAISPAMAALSCRILFSAVMDGSLARRST